MTERRSIELVHELVHGNRELELNAVHVLKFELELNAVRVFEDERQMNAVYYFLQ